MRGGRRAGTYPPAIACCLFLALANAAPTETTDAAAVLEKRILEESSLFSKQALARSLGRLQTREASGALRHLLSAPSYWDRLAAVEGLAMFTNAEVRRALAVRVAGDHMIRDRIVSVVLADGAGFCPALIEAYHEETSESGRKELLALLGRLKDPAAAFLTQRVRDPSEPLRREALEALVGNRPASVALARECVEEPSLRITALALVQSAGTAQDLPLFRKILADTNEGVEAAVLAYRAVAAWGDDALRLGVYRSALAQAGEAGVYGALAAFREFTNGQVFPELCRTTKSARLQATRFLAAENLMAYHRREAWPYLIPLLREQWNPEAGHAGVDIAFSILTVGISSVFDRLRLASSRTDFTARVEKIRAYLQKESGAYPGTSFEAWRDWAVLQGFTVDGMNLLQSLFSPVATQRGKAVDAAARILGFRGREAFLAANPGLQGRGDSALRLELARLLEAGGFLKDEVP